MKKTFLILTGIIALGSAGSLKAVNIAAGAAVTLNGTFGTDPGFWAYHPPADASTLTDGTFLPEGQTWNFQTVWWNRTTQPANNIVLNLGGLYNITELTAQGDDNDTYRIEYWNGASWLNVWEIPVAGGGGMRTRVSGALNFNTDMLRFTATGGDDFVSVSEIQAQGQAVSTPDAGSTFALFLAGLAALAWARVRR
jgi:hypothetical protein